jgi:hypothetical protein
MFLTGMQLAPSGKDDAPAGYAHPRYARSHAQFGVPRELPRCKGWIVERPIPGFSDRDAMGCYPLFACGDWSKLHDDVDELTDELVSLTLVVDPFGDYDEAYLRRCFPDMVLPFKEHYVIDLEKPRNRVVSKHHRYEARKALRQVTVQSHPNPPAFLDVWMSLHGRLIRKHDITGAEQLSTPGMVVMQASLGTEPVAAMLYYLQGEVAHAHLLGCTELGYAHGALYALLWHAIETFTGSVHWLNIMGVPGHRDSGSEGIRQFKRGWTRELRTAWLCGRVLDRTRYAALVAATGTSASSYFPAYRDGA